MSQISGTGTSAFTANSISAPSTRPSCNSDLVNQSAVSSVSSNTSTLNSDSSDEQAADQFQWLEVSNMMTHLRGMFQNGLRGIQAVTSKA